MVGCTVYSVWFSVGTDYCSRSKLSPCTYVGCILRGRLILPQQTKTVPLYLCWVYAERETDIIPQQTKTGPVLMFYICREGD